MKSILLLLTILSPALAYAAETNRPNLLIIHTDEHNFRTLGCYRAMLSREQAYVWGEGVAVETPHIDSIARRGAICDRFYAASPVCTPSRASFVTGRYPQNTGAHSNDLPMRDSVVTFAEAMRRSGYRTGYAGKWHLDGESKPGWGPARRFGFEDNRYMFNRGHWKQLEDTANGPAVKATKNGTPTYNVEGANAKSFATDFLADKTVAFIQAHRNEPFCFMVSLPDPHGPNTVRAPYDAMFADLKFQRPGTAGKSGAFENMARYFGMVKCIDDNVGKILGALQAAGILEKTIVVFTADHGDMCGEHGLVNKGVPYEGSARIPFVITWPGKIKAGTVVHQALNTVDFKPTVLGLVGLPADAGDEGRDASKLLLTGRAPEGWEDVTISRNSEGRWLMAVSSRYKLIVSNSAAPSLFDLDADPLETRNLFSEAASRPVVRQLAKAILDYGKRCKEPFLDQSALRADVTWAAEGTGDYVAPKRDGVGGKKGRQKAKKSSTED